MVQWMSGIHRPSHGVAKGGLLPALLVAAASAALATFAAVAAIAEGKAPRSGAPKPTVVYVGGDQRDGLAMARIEARAKGPRNHAVKVIRASVQRPAPPPGSPIFSYGHCSSPSYSFGKDADVIELRPGRFWLRVEAERVFPLPSAFAPASVFEIDAKVTLRGGRCYTPVMTCGAEATDATTCHLTLKEQRCEPLRSPHRIVLPTIYAC